MQKSEKMLISPIYDGLEVIAQKAKWTLNTVIYYQMFWSQQNLLTDFLINVKIDDQSYFKKKMNE